MSPPFHQAKSLSLVESQWYEMQLGDLFFYVMQKGDAYWTALDYQLSSSQSLAKSLEPIDTLPEHLQVKEKIYLPELSESPLITLQLADKPYQVNPAADVKIAPKSRLVLYVSTPLWLQLQSISDGKILAEYPTIIPRLSWVGGSTTEGSLCYSTRTSAPSVFSEVRQYQHRALTALELINDGDQLLNIDRLSLPLNTLGLYHSASDGYWTESVRYRINTETGETTVVAAQRPPEELRDVVTISKSRDSNKASRFRTAMNIIMG